MNNPQWGTIMKTDHAPIWFMAISLIICTTLSICVSADYRPDLPLWQIIATHLGLVTAGVIIFISGCLLVTPDRKSIHLPWKAPFRWAFATGIQGAMILGIIWRTRHLS